MCIYVICMYICTYICYLHYICYTISTKGNKTICVNYYYFEGKSNTHITGISTHYEIKKFLIYGD